jgi:hypothetical protein
MLIMPPLYTNIGTPVTDIKRDRLGTNRKEEFKIGRKFFSSGPATKKEHA